MFYRFLFFILVFCNCAFSQADFNVSIKLNQYDSIYFSEASNISSNAITIYSDTTFSIKSSSKLFYVQTNKVSALNYWRFLSDYSTATNRFTVLALRYKTSNFVAKNTKILSILVY